MIEQAAPSTLFGVSRGLEPSEAAELASFFTAAWEAQYARPPSTISTDLELLSKLFRKDIQGRGLRAAAADLRPISLERPLLPEEVFIPFDDRRGLVTPEGRILLEELRWMQSADVNMIPRDRMLSAVSTIAEFYGDSTRRWIGKELSGGDIRPSTYGFVVLLLINGSIGKECALSLPGSGAQEAQLAAAIMPVVNAFSVAMGGKPLTARESGRLRSNWAVTEASRQLHGMIRRADGPDSAVRIWIDETKEAALSEMLGGRLARRKGLTMSAMSRAMESAVDAYAEARPSLVSWGMSFERASHTQSVVSALLDGFSRSLTLAH